MPDIMLPQVSPAPAKAPGPPAAAAETAAGAQGKSDFSQTLQAQMPSESARAETPAEQPADPVTAAAEASDGAATAGAEAGNPLPLSGKPAAATGNPAAATGNPAAVLAVLDAMHQGAQTEAETAANAEAVLLPGLPLPTVALVVPGKPGSAAGSVRPTAAPSSASGEAAQARRTALPGVRLDLPEPAQANLAQAVREALAEGSEPSVSRPVAEAAAAALRAMAAAQPKLPLLDGVQERLTATPTSAVAGAATPGTPLTPELLGARAALPSTTLDTPFRQPGWDQALSERVMWVANQKFQMAEIKMNPPQLGPIEVRVQVQQDQTQISFTAHNAAVRDALEAALPRLREMFNASGQNLVDVNVSQHSFAEQQRQAQGGRHGGGATQTDEAESGLVAQQARAQSVVAARGGVDLFV
ncbi:MAG: flagellar hook-length control protein FliK [Gammaproteobacteria bacterium]